MQRARLALFLIASGWFALAGAQTAPAPAAPVAGIQSQNIMDVKPEASDAPGYAQQTNGERTKVQPGNNAPMWRQVGSGVTGYSSLPKTQDPEAGNLIQPMVQYPGSRLTTAGEAWRQVRNNWIIPYGGSLVVIVLLAIALFYKTKGTIQLHGELTGRKIERFTPFERAAHWSNAIAFCALAISGLFMAFGKFFLLPIMPDLLFGWITYALKNIHNFAGPLFAVSLVIVFATFVKDNWPQKGDLNWVLKGGGLVGGEDPASHRFNAGEKLVFWGGVFLLGIVVVSSGFVLDKIVPGLIYERGTMQIAMMIHGVATLLMVCMFLGHIYLGTLGQAGAYQGMKTGYVDETWAKEHHQYWYEDVKAGKIPAQRTVKNPSGTGASVQV